MSTDAIALSILPEAPTEPSISASRLRTLIYGRPKVGKSTLAAQFPRALFLDCEGGLAALRVYRAPVGSWRDFLDLCNAIVTTEHRYETLVVDTVDALYQRCVESVCARLQIAHESEADYGKAYSMIASEFSRVLQKLALLPYGLVLISHATEREVRTRTGKTMRLSPSLPDRINRIATGIVDLILYMELDVAVSANGEIIERRCIRTKPTSYFDAGDRTGLLPDSLDPSWEALEGALRGAGVGAADDEPSTAEASAAETPPKSIRPLARRRAARPSDDTVAAEILAAAEIGGN